MGSHGNLAVVVDDMVVVAEVVDEDADVDDISFPVSKNFEIFDGARFAERAITLIATTYVCHNLNII